MQNVFTDGTQGIQSPHIAVNLSSFPINEDFAFLGLVIETDEDGIIHFAKLWDTSGYIFFGKVAAKDGYFEDGAIISAHRAAEGNELNGSSFFLFPNQDVIFVLDIGLVTGTQYGRAQAWNGLAFVDAPGGKEAPLVVPDPSSAYHNDNPPYSAGRIYFGRDLGTVFLVFLPGYGQIEDTETLTKGAITLEIDRDGAGKVLDFRASGAVAPYIPGDYFWGGYNDNMLASSSDGDTDVLSLVNPPVVFGTPSSYELRYAVHSFGPQIHDPAASSFNVRAYTDFPTTGGGIFISVSTDTPNAIVTVSGTHTLSVGDYVLLRTFSVPGPLPRKWYEVISVLSPSQFTINATIATPASVGQYFGRIYLPGNLLFENSTGYFGAASPNGNYIWVNTIGTGIPNKDTYFPPLTVEELFFERFVYDYMRVVDSNGRSTTPAFKPDWPINNALQWGQSRAWPAWRLDLHPTGYMQYDPGTDTDGSGDYVALYCDSPISGFNDEADDFLITYNAGGGPFNGPIPGWPGIVGQYYPKAVGFLGTPARNFTGGLVYASRSWTNWREWIKNPGYWRDFDVSDIGRVIGGSSSETYRAYDYTGSTIRMHTIRGTQTFTII